MVGTATFTVVDGNTITFDYTVKLGGMAHQVMQQKTITREIFSTGDDLSVAPLRGLR